MFFTFIAFIGIASALSGGYHWGVVEWDPMALVAHWDSRAARFFAAFSFALAALGVNISANSLSAANGMLLSSDRSSGWQHYHRLLIVHGYSRSNGACSTIHQSAPRTDPHGNHLLGACSMEDPGIRRVRGLKNNDVEFSSNAIKVPF
jgi:hypothetical protein